MGRGAQGAALVTIPDGHFAGEPLVPTALSHQRDEMPDGALGLEVAFVRVERLPIEFPVADITAAADAGG